MTPNTASSAHSDHGPFRATQVSVYCDESRHEGQSKQRYMVIGGLWIERDKRHRILDRLRAVQRTHSITGEVKWNKLSKRSLAGYQALADYVAQEPDAYFRCVVVDKDRMDTDPMVRSDRQLGFWAFYAHCLKGWMGSCNTYYVSLDYKPSKHPFGPLRLKKLLDQECVGRAWIRSIESVNSQENLFCQVADTLIGAVGYEANGLTGSTTKLAFCRHVRASFGYSAPAEALAPARFNVQRLPA
jgi:hypothetical protein